MCDLIEALHELDFGEFLMVKTNEKLTFYKEAEQFDDR